MDAAMARLASKLRIAQVWCVDRQRRKGAPGDSFEIARRFGQLPVAALEAEPGRLRQVGQQLLLGENLDRGHSHLARRLEVDAEIVEIDARRRRHLERL